MKLILVLLVLGAIGVSSGLLSTADAAPSATRIIDRTLRCTTGIQGGAPVVFVTARTAFGQGSRLDWLAEASIVAAGQPVPTRQGFRPTLAGLTAGWPPPEGFASGGMAFHNRRCVPARTSLGFLRGGLTGGPAGHFGDDYQCRVPRTMLVRIRAVFRDPVDLRLIGGRAFASAEGRIEQGQITVQTLARKPLVYADVTDGGRARLFTAQVCQ